MKLLLHSKDTKFYCGFCGSHFCTSKVDIFRGDVFQVSQFYENQGQAPFFSHEKAQCKDCGKLLSIANIVTYKKEEE